MGHQIIKQPDGLLAVFDSVTDSWIFADATEKELLKYYEKRAAKQARKETLRVLEAVQADEPHRVYYQFTKTFKEANNKHNSNHPKVFKKGKFVGFE